MLLGSHCVKGYSSTQATVAMSSGEAELYAMTKGAAMVLGLISLGADFGLHLSGIVHCDASAALGIVNRQGLGKLRHINVRYLWLQEKVRGKELDVLKVAGTENPADLLTNNLDAETMWRHVGRLGFYVAEGRATLAPKLRPGEVEVEPGSALGADSDHHDNPCQGAGPGFQMVASSGTSVRQTRDGETQLVHQLTGAAVTPTGQDCPSVACRPVPLSRKVSSAASDRPSPCRAGEQDHPSVAGRPVMPPRRASSVNNNDSTDSMRHPLEVVPSGMVEQDSPGVAPGASEEQASPDVFPGEGVGDGCFLTAPKGIRWIQVLHTKPSCRLVTPIRVDGVPPIRALAAMRVTEGTWVRSGKSF